MICHLPSISNVKSMNQMFNTLTRTNTANTVIAMKNRDYLQKTFINSGYYQTLNRHLTESLQKAIGLLLENKNRNFCDIPKFKIQIHDKINRK